MKIFYKITLFFIIVTLFINCSDNIDLEGKTTGVLYFPNTGVHTLVSYDVGEIFEEEIWVGKGGLSSKKMRAEIIIDESLLDSINAKMGSSYKILPKECYELDNQILYISGISAQGKTTLKYDPSKILSKSGNIYDTEIYMLPIKLISDDNVNKTKNTIFYTFIVSDPTLQITNDAIVNVDLTTGGKIDLATEIGVPFTNKWDITVSIVKRQEEVDKYNNVNNSFFSLLPKSMYTGKDEVTLSKGENRTNIVYTINTQELTPGNYILPIQIGALSASLNGVATENIKFDTSKTKLFLISKLGEKLPKDNWSIVSTTTEEPSGEGSNNGRAIHMIDDKISSFWHSKWKGGNDPLPYEIVIDMGKVHLVSQIEIVPRNISNNSIKYLRFETSTDGTNWEYVGHFDFDRESNSLMYPVKTTNCRYIKLIIPKDGAENRVTSIRELTVYGK